MRIIAVVNQKGGSGKTTTTVNLAAALANLNKSVLVVDLDPQASATSWLGVADGGQDLLNVLVENGNLDDIIINTEIGNVSVVASSTWLVGIEKALANEVGAELILRRCLQELSGRGYDYILLDCPPTLGLLTVSALTAAREVLIPVETHVMALSGLAQLLQTVQVVRERLNTDLQVMGILPCRVDRRTRHAGEIVEELRNRFEDLVFETIIRENVRLAEAPSFAQPIAKYDPSSTGAFDYGSLAREVEKRGKKSRK